MTRQLDTAVGQNYLSGQVVDPLQPISSSMVTGSTIVISTKSNELSKFTKNEDVKGSLVKENSDNVSAFSEHSSLSHQQEQFDFVTRQTETSSNLTSNKSNNVVSSIVSNSHSSSQHLTMSKSNSIPTGMYVCVCIYVCVCVHTHTHI